MSFLEDAEDSATLAATLAFVDSWGASSTDSSSAGSPTSTDVSKADAKASKKTKKRKKYPNSSSTVLQRRKKAEILALREQAELLEAQLQQLKRNPSRKLLLPNLEDNKEVSLVPITWADQASIQYQYRLEAEKTNRKLKSILNNQVKVHEALRTVLQKSSVLEGIDVVWQNPCRPVADAPWGMEQLEKRVQSLYLDADAVFQSHDVADVSVSSTVKESHALGKMLELASTTPMRCSLHEASEKLWKYFGRKKATRHDSDTIERNYQLQVKSDVGALDFTKQNAVRRFEEDHRVVVIWTDTLRLPKFGLLFRNETWMLLARSPEDPSGSSTLRTFQQLYMDCQDNPPIDDATFVQEPAFEGLSKMYRHWLQTQQSSMLEEGQRSASSSQVSV